MVVRVAAGVEAELDEIWSFVAVESGDADVAQRLINSITDHVLYVVQTPTTRTPS